MANTLLKGEEMNDEVKAINEWLDSDKGIKCCDPLTLGISGDKRIYLGNRLRHAFEAGMEAGITITKGRIIGKFLELLNSIK